MDQLLPAIVRGADHRRWHTTESTGKPDAAIKPSSGLEPETPVNLLAYALLSSPATASADPSVVIQSGKSIGCL